MIYHLNCDGIYHHISAIETVQLNRQRCFDALEEPNTHIFCGMYTETSIYKLMTGQGFDMSRIIWIYDFYSDFKIAPVSYSLSRFEQMIPENFKKTGKDNKITYTWQNSRVKQIVLLEDGCVFRVDVYNGDKLICRDYYTYEKVWTEYFSDNKIYLRRFYNTDGSISVEEIFDNEDKSDDKAMFKLSDSAFISRAEFIENMLVNMDLTKNDIVFVDRYLLNDLFLQRLYNLTNIFYIFHSTHHEVNESDKNFVKLMGYGTKFRLRNQCAGYIVATQSQVKDAKEHIKIMYNEDYNKVWSVPFGCIEGFKQSSNRKSHSFISVGRLVASKGFDVAIRAVAKAKKYVPDITLDIYGLGLLRSYLTDLIEKLDCSANIRLCGFHDLTDKYLEYDGFLTATLYEGGSLVFVETLGSGCPIICFDTLYMGLAAVKNGYNGYSVHLDSEVDEDNRVDMLAEKIVQYCNLNITELNAMRNNAYSSVKQYLFEGVTDKWRQFLIDIQH